MFPEKQGRAVVKELLEQIARSLVDHPDQVSVRAVVGEQVTVFELRVSPSDMGQIIGRQGRIAQAIRAKHAQEIPPR